jgi:hypothetical protein
MMDYNHWAPLGLVGEMLPDADNHVTLADDNDLGAPPVRHDLAPPDPWGKGMPCTRNRKPRATIGPGDLRPAGKP